MISYTRIQIGNETCDKEIKPLAHLQRVREAGNLAESGSDKWTFEGAVKSLGLVSCDAVTSVTKSRM